CWRYSRLWLYITDDVQAESFGEVWKRPMIRDHLHAFVRGHHVDPSLLGLAHPVNEIIQSLLEIRAVIGPKFRQFVEDFAGDDLAVLRIQPIVRISERMDIAFCTGDLTLRNFKNPHLKRRI